MNVSTPGTNNTVMKNHDSAHNRTTDEQAFTTAKSSYDQEIDRNYEGFPPCKDFRLVLGDCPIKKLTNIIPPKINPTA